MKVSCPACDSKYTIADEKVAGRKVKVRCKSCGGQILINGTIPPPAPDAADGKTGAADSNPAAISLSDVPPKDGTVKEAPHSAPKNAPVAAPQIDDGIIWSVNVSEDDERSLPTRDVVAGYLSGDFAGEVYVWHDGMSDWAPITDVPELARAIEAAKTTEPKGAEPAPAPKQKVLPSAGKGGKTTETSPNPETAKKQAARASGAKRPQSAHDLFAAANAAGSELDVAVSEEDDAAQKKTGARNENSVLFSLDALKAGITASPAQESKAGGRKGPAPAAPRKKLEDIMVRDAPAVGPAASPLMLSTNQALLMAPAPPPPKPKPEPVVVAAPVVMTPEA